MRFPRHEYWNSLPFPAPGDLPYQRLNPCLLYPLHWQEDSLPLVQPGKWFNYASLNHLAVHTKLTQHFESTILQYWYFSQQTWSQLVLPPAQALYKPACKLNKQSDNIQPWCAPFPVWNQSIVPCPVLTVASWPAYRFLRRQVRFSGIPISLRIFHSLLWPQRLWHSQWSRSRCCSAILWLFYDPTDVGNLISGSSIFSKSSLNIWKFSVYILLKPGLENFEHFLASMWNECNCAVVWLFFALPFFGIGMKTDLFQSCGHCWVFPICCHTECSSLTA